MKLLLLLLLAICASSAHAAAAQHTNAAPQRLISLAPHTTEMAAALGLEQQLVAISDYSDYPASVSHLPHVAGYHGIAVEQIIALKPDLVLAWQGGNPQAALDQLRSFGIHLFISSATTPEQLLDELLALGQATGREPQAQALVAELQQRLDQLAARYSQRQPLLAVFYQLWKQPLMTSGGPSWLTPLLGRCGARNVFADHPQPYPQVDIEQVISRQPEVIIIAEGDGQLWHHWPAVAGSKPRLLPLNPDLLQRMGPRLIDGLEQLCQQLWPEPATTPQQEPPA